MTPPRAGSWIRIRSEATGWTSHHWHLFTGDMVWRSPWPTPSLETACGYTIGRPTGLEKIETSDDEPSAPCRRCFARSG